MAILFDILVSGMARFISRDIGPRTYIVTNGVNNPPSSNQLPEGAKKCFNSYPLFYEYGQNNKILCFNIPGYEHEFCTLQTPSSSLTVSGVSNIFCQGYSACTGFVYDNIGYIVGCIRGLDN